MTATEFDAAWFSLVEVEDTYPVTGIKINIDNVSSYQSQSTFRFIDDTASKDATLSDLIVSSGIVDEENSENTTYKEYQLVPTFDKETQNYEIELLEYLDTLDIKAILSDENASMKIKVPKRDEDNELEYETDGITIKYEEKEILSDTPLEVTLNKLGEPDTKLTIKVTAEDEITTKEYEIVIHRPYGTIKGSIQLGDGLRESIQESYGTYVEYIATATIYEADQFNWDGIITKEESLDNLDLLDKKAQVETDKDDGSYTLYVIPGEYDLILERLGFLANIITKIDISAGETIELENKILLEGDTDRTGIIDLDDIVSVVNMSDTMQGDGIYDEIYDFGQKGFVAIDDLVSVVTNSDSLINIEQYTK